MSRRLRRQTVKNNPVWSKSQDPRIVFNCAPNIVFQSRYLEANLKAIQRLKSSLFTEDTAITELAKQLF